MQLFLQTYIVYNILCYSEKNDKAYTIIMYNVPITFECNVMSARCLVYVGHEGVDFQHFE